VNVTFSSVMVGGVDLETPGGEAGGVELRAEWMVGW
jgi:hypothetical protein